MPYLSQFYQLLEPRINEEELRALCFDLSLDYDNLGGRGKAANIRELLAHLDRRSRLPELVVLCRQLRPLVDWPDPPPPPGRSAQRAWQAQAQTLFAQARRLLAPPIRLEASRYSLFSEAFYPAHEWALDQIDYSGTAAVFLPRCWQTLRDIAPDGSLHILLLGQLRWQYGVEQQREIDDLITAWQEHCALRTAVRPAPPPSLPPRRQVADTTGQPTIFLSYTDRDAALAEQLRTELAAYGHVCQTLGTAQRGGGDWLAETAAGLGGAYAVLLLVGEQSAADRWQRIEYLGATDRHKPIIPLRLKPDVSLPVYLRETALDAAAVGGTELSALLQRLPAPPAPAHRSWTARNDALRPRLAELLYMDRLKLAELHHVAQYTRLGGEAQIKRGNSGRVNLNPVVARTEFVHSRWRRDAVEKEAPVERFPFTDAVAQLQSIRRAVLLGDPGSGKTTTLYRLAADLIDAALPDKSAPVPLMARLGLWTDADEPFPDFLRRAVGELGDYLEPLLESGRAALLLDGINEIPSDQQAVKYRQVAAFLAAQPAVMGWVSCREQDYPPDRDLGLDKVTVAPLDAVRVEEFIGNYLDRLPAFGKSAAADLFWQLAGEAAQERYGEFEAAVEEKLLGADVRFTAFWLDDTLPDGVNWGWGFEGYENNDWEAWLKQRAHPASLLLLATNPYMLFMLLDVYQAYGRLPANRGQLFDQFVETLLEREGLLRWDETARRMISLPQGAELLRALTALAFALQTRRAGQEGDAAALTALPLAEASRYLSAEQQYQAVSANLLTIGRDVRFAHQLLQEYFAARAMRQRIFPANEGGASARLQAAEIWPSDRWWEPTNWEEATILLAGLFSDDCTPVLKWVADAQPEVAARCIVESGAHTPEETKTDLRQRWLPRLTDLGRDPDARARAAVGRALGRVTMADGAPLDNRAGVGFIRKDGLKIPDIVWGGEVPAGTYTIGGDEAAYHSFDERQITIAFPYRLARYPITNAQFDCFATAPDVADDRWWRGMPDEKRQIDAPDFPRINNPRETVSWYQATAFCRWLSDKLGYKVQLPHEYEWEMAARWDGKKADGRFYPWGNTFDATKANTREGDRIGQTTAVGLYPSGRNKALDLYDLSGNVFEWQRNKYDNPEDEGIDNSNGRRVLRGGSWSYNQNHARAAARLSFTPGARYDYHGFRVVVLRRPPSHHDH